MEAIKNAIYLLKTRLDPESQPIYEALRSETERVTRIVRQMLGLYRNAGHLGSFDLNSIIEDTLALFHALNLPHVSFLLDILQELPTEAGLSQLFSTLLGLSAARRAEYRRERGRRRIPRILLSDGTDAEAAYASPAAEGAIKGTPASPGIARGVARVILSPAGATLEPGDVLVAPSTDPGWTPLFLTASALVMEMGGMMSHGAVVAREYGIPAVVGVPDATERIATGTNVTVDGSAGTVTTEP